MIHNACLRRMCGQGPPKLECGSNSGRFCRGGGSLQWPRPLEGVPVCQCLSSSSVTNASARSRARAPFKRPPDTILQAQALQCPHPAPSKQEGAQLPSCPAPSPPEFGRPLPPRVRPPPMEHGGREGRAGSVSSVLVLPWGRPGCPPLRAALPEEEDRGSPRPAHVMAPPCVPAAHSEHVRWSADRHEWRRPGPYYFGAPSPMVLIISNT